MAGLLQQIGGQLPSQFSGGGGAGLGFPLPNIAAKIPPQYQAALKVFILAGKRTMYSPQSRKLLQRELAKPIPLPQKLAEGVVGLVLILYMENGRRIPLPILIPAAIELLGDAAQFVGQITGQQVTKQIYGQAVALATAMLAKKLGIVQQFAQVARRGAPQLPGAQAPSTTWPSGAAMPGIARSALAGA
jgi:hypothetical protein